MIRYEMLDALEGLIPPSVGVRLLTFASAVPEDLAIVEIGSYKGKSACYLAEGARIGRGAHIWAIDPWELEGNEDGRHGFARPDTRAAFARQVTSMGLSDHITAVQAFSEDAAHQLRDLRVGLLYVDGSHLHDDVSRDWAAWSPKLTGAWTVIFDDYRTTKNPGVEHFVDELRAARPDLSWEFDGRLAIAQAVEG